MAQGLYQLSHDPDIEAGRESVHPDWVSLYNNAKSSERTADYLPESVWTDVASFFNRLQAVPVELQSIDPATTKIAFLLGAGASKPAPSGIPTVKELLADLLSRARRLDRDDLTKLADFCDKTKITNIEDLLTAAQLATFCSRNPNVFGLINMLLYRGSPEEQQEFKRAYTRAVDLSSVAFLQDTLQVLFGLLSSTMLPAKPNHAHKAIADYVTKHPATGIVTTNYDCCVDLALGKENENFTYGVEFRNVGTTATKVHTRLVKLHGSLNWFYCDTCQEVQLYDIKRTISGFMRDLAPYPVIGICKTCGGQLRGLLVPPLAMKFDAAPPLTPLIRVASDIFRAADVIVVVGFSFADADLYISRMLTKSMQTTRSQKILIIDPDEYLVDRVRRKFEASVPKFDPRRVLTLRGDCATQLPDFLYGRLMSGLDGSRKTKVHR